MSDQASAVAAKGQKRFYVYKLYETPEVILYVGKGSGRRLKTQMRRFSLKGEVLREFDCERKAFKFEQDLIVSARPELNRNKGGSGGWVKYKKSKSKPRSQEEREMDRIGTRAYCARMLLRFDLRGLVDREKYDRIKEVAYAAPL